jgi:hypothetical protein
MNIDIKEESRRMQRNCFFQYDKLKLTVGVFRKKHIEYILCSFAVLFPHGCSLGVTLDEVSLLLLGCNYNSSV